MRPWREHLKLFFLTVQVVNSVTTNQECVNDISASEVLAYLLMALPMLPSCKSDIDQNEIETGSHQIQRDWERLIYGQKRLRYAHFRVTILCTHWFYVLCTLCIVVWSDWMSLLIFRSVTDSGEFVFSDVQHKDSEGGLDEGRPYLPPGLVCQCHQPEREREDRWADGQDVGGQAGGAKGQNYPVQVPAGNLYGRHEGLSWSKCPYVWR